MAIINGVGRIGIRNYVATQQITTSTLLNSLYSVWNADTLGTSLDTSIVGVWNAEASNNATVKNAWNANGNAIDSKSGANGTIVVSNGTTGTMVGTMSFGTGKLGSGAFTFNGSNFIQLPADTFNFTGDFSVSMWVYIPSTATSDPRYASVGVPLLTAFDNKNGYTTYRGWGGLSWYGNRVSFDTGGYSYGGSQVTSVSATMSSMNQWVHIVGTRKYASTTTLYINGVKMSQANITYVPTYNNNNLATIGGSSFAFSNPWFKGTIAGVKIDAVQTWNGSELDQAAVTELYNSGAGQEYPFTVSNASIVTFNDSVGSNNGTSPVGSVPTFTTGKIGNAFTFDGVNDYVALPDNSLNLDGSMSFSFWIKTSNTTSYGIIIGNVQQARSPYGFTHGYEISINTGYVYTSYRSGININKSLQSTTLVATNSWNHVVVTYNPGTGTNGNATGNKIYINGVLNISGQTLDATGSSTIHYTSPMKACIGVRNYSGTPSDFIPSSNLDSVSIWSKELTQDEIGQLYNAGTGAQYPFSSQTLPSAKNQFAIDNGTLMNGCTLTDGKIGKAFTFDGVNDYVALPDNSLNFTGDFTTSFWFYANAFTSQDSFVTCENWVSPNDNGWYIYHMQGNLGFSVYNGTNATGWKTSTTITTGTWYHVVVVKNRSVSPKFYINGALVDAVLRHGTDTTLNPGYVTTQYCSLGTDRYAVSTAHAYLNGKMDGVNVWQREITQAEVTELYNSGAGKQLTPTPIVTNGLVLNLDAGRKSSYPNTGTTWTDISGNGYNGTMTNGPIFGTASGGQITFDGIDDNVNMGSNSAFNLTNISISIWVKLDTTASNNFIVGRYFTTTVDNGWFIYYSPTTQKIRFEGRESEALYISNQSTNNYNVNTWYNIVCTKSANTWSIYSNGVLDMSQSIGLGNVAFANNNMQFGGMFTNFGNNYGKHSIGSIHMYNRALSATEITQNFNATKSRFGL